MKPLPAPIKMNKTEARYAGQLELLKRSGQIVDYRFEKLNFKLANRTYYKPDFFIVFKDHFEIHEVKGFLRDDANVKFKVAAEMFPWFKWKMVGWDAKNRTWVLMKESK